jgi:lipid II:glycine glycyltransferase (peptidoglycan interpeptide bridge formation enzyme)
MGSTEDSKEMEDIRQTEEWAEYLRSFNWKVEKVGKVLVFIKKIPLTPLSMMKIQRFSGELDLDGLKKLKKKHKVVYTVAEPALGYDPLSAQWPKRPAPPISGVAPFRVGPLWRVNKNPFLPTKTVIIDLENSKEKLWSDLSVNAKRILRKGFWTSQNDEKGGNNRKRHSGKLSLRNASRTEFYKAWKDSSKTWVMSEERLNKLIDSFAGKASLWVSESEDGVLSGILLLKSKDTVNYFQTFTTDKGRQTGAHYQLVWEAILKSKRDGYKYFDFEGVIDKRWPQKKWGGFSEFKGKFGGRAINYPGSFVKWF